MISLSRMKPIGLWVGFRLQLAELRTQADIFYAFVTAPCFALIFMSIAEYTGQRHMAVSALIAPTLMTMWDAALTFSGDIIGDDRENGRLEPLVASPAAFSPVLCGRLLACMTLSLPAFTLSVLVAGVIFDHWIVIHHPLLFVATLLVTGLATAGTSTALAAVFVASSGARIIQNTLSYPIFLLGGVVVPTSAFPDWLESVSGLVYLSWSADLLRAAQEPAPIDAAAARLVAIALLGGAALGIGRVVIARLLRQARHQGTLTRV
ncbi:ABC transporter permease [Nonomuraea sp. NPDC051941]|uniref:ABC transporter permease n=1 Tax=Nonomuraea sp. NPDC051941 TaxID=3364373 RepID=UPI0037CB3721